MSIKIATIDFSQVDAALEFLPERSLVTILLVDNTASDPSNCFMINNVTDI